MITTARSEHRVMPCPVPFRGGGNMTEVVDATLDDPDA